MKNLKHTFILLILLVFSVDSLFALAPSSLFPISGTAVDDRAVSDASATVASSIEEERSEERRQAISFRKLRLEIAKRNRIGLPTTDLPDLDELEKSFRSRSKSREIPPDKLQRKREYRKLIAAEKEAKAQRYQRYLNKYKEAQVKEKKEKKYLAGLSRERKQQELKERKEQLKKDVMPAAVEEYREQIDAIESQRKTAEK